MARFATREPSSARRRPLPPPAASAVAPEGETQGEVLLPIARWPRLTISWVGFAVYLVVIHSFRIAVGQIAILTSLIGLLIERARVRVPAAFGWCVGLLAWAALTILLSEEPGQSWGTWQDYAKVLLILVAATNAPRDPSQISGILVFWLGCFALWPVRGTLFNFAYGIGHFGRYAWNYIFANPNDLASICLLMLGLTLVGCGARNSKPLRWASIIGTAILTVMVFLTQSRAGFLGFSVFALIAVTTHRKRTKALLVLGLLATLVVVVAPSSVWTRIGGLGKATSTSTLSEVDPEGSAENRYRIWQIAFDMSRDYPVTGVGFGNFENRFHEFLLRRPEWRNIRALAGGRDTHSSYINALAEMGYVGLFLLLGFIISGGVFLARTARRLSRDAPKQGEQFKFLLASWVGYWIAAIFATIYRIVMPYIFIGFATALAGYYTQLSRPAAAPVPPAIPRGTAPAPGRARRTA